MHARRLSFLCPNLTKTFFSSLAYSAAPTNDLSTLSKYLIDAFSFPPKRALSVSKRFQNCRQNPQSAVDFLRQFGFSKDQIQSSVITSPQIIFSDVDNVLKPKLEYFHRHLGLSADDLGHIVAKNPKLLLCSLDKVLIPYIEILKKMLVTSNSTEVVKVMGRSRFLGCRNGQTNLISNVALLEDRCKITGHRLANFLMRLPNILFLPEAFLGEKVARALELGIPVDSGMFRYALATLCGMTKETFNEKLKLLKSFGFSEDECLQMFRRAPGVFLASEEALRVRVDFFQNQINDINKFGRALLVIHPYVLKFSFEERVIPRCRVLSLVMSKKLLKKVAISAALCKSEQYFLERYVMRFKDDADELLNAYRGNR